MGLLDMDRATDSRPAPAASEGVLPASELAPGRALGAVVVDARSCAELFARPHADRAVIVNGRLPPAWLVDLPDFEDLDDQVFQATAIDWDNRPGVQRGGVVVPDS